jgi:hypothetical protein
MLICLASLREAFPASLGPRDSGLAEVAAREGPPEQTARQ